MSVKIYYGLKVKAKNLEESHKFCLELRHDMLPMIKTALNADLMILHVHFVDIFTFCKTHFPIKVENNYGKMEDVCVDGKIPDTTSSLIYKELKESKQMIASGMFPTFFNFDYVLMLFPLKNEVLCLPYDSNGLLSSQIKKSEKFVEFGYWDNSDMPDGVKTREWNQRKRKWQIALGKDFEFSPIERFFEYSVFSCKEIYQTMYSLDLIGARSEFLDKMDNEFRIKRLYNVVQASLQKDGKDLSIEELFEKYPVELKTKEEVISML